MWMGLETPHGGRTNTRISQKRRMRKGPEMFDQGVSWNIQNEIHTQV